MQKIAENKKANFDYFISEKYEAGIVLSGSEVKSLRVNTGSIKESYIIEKNNELWLVNCHIKKYSSSNETNYNPLKNRKILVKRKEMNKIIGASKKNGMTTLRDAGIHKVISGETTISEVLRSTVQDN